MRHTATSSIVRHAARLALATLLVGASGCRSATDNGRQEDAPCPQTYEFGNYGCARIVALVEGPAAPWPAAYRLDVRASPVRTALGAVSALAPDARFGPVPLQLTLWGPPPPRPDDTLSVWVVARMRDDSPTSVIGRPLPLVAADSTLTVVQFAPVGDVPRVDTLRLRLR